jgi:ABC-type nickel/cobalt efflux system permease component RcnA
MSIGAQSLALPASQKRGPAPRLFLAVSALVLVALGTAVLMSLFVPSAPPTPTKTPFGMGIREAAPSTGGLGGAILMLQSRFYALMQSSVTDLKQSGTALWSLLGLGFAYGIFHAAGPGHGKAVIAAYLVSDERALAKGFTLSLAAALVQALVAVMLVSSVAIVLRATAETMNRVATGVEWTSFIAVTLLGLALTWRKAGKALGVWTLARNPLAGSQAASCDHVHLPPPEALKRLTRWKDMAAVVLAAGIRPCAGALIILVFALAHGLFAAGVAATVAMALGTALTTGLIATVAVFAKEFALRMAGGRGAVGEVLVAGLELAAAAFVAVLGSSLLLGLWSTTGG